MLFLVGSMVQVAQAAQAAPIRLVDAEGNTVTLPGLAQRIISLAPHFTELIYSLGMEKNLVGAVEFSDYPEAAKKIPRIGNATRFDLEKILSLHPDLVLAWKYGIQAQKIDQLRQLKLPVVVLDTNSLAAINQTLKLLSAAGGSSRQSTAVISQFEQRWQQLRRDNAGKPSVTVFYQIWQQPLMTLGGRHIFSEVLQLCGGRNIFAPLAQLSATISPEAVLAQNPEVIIASGMTTNDPQTLSLWKKWPQITAVQRGNLVTMQADLLQRQSLRLLDGTQLLCGALDAARSKRRPAK